MSATYTSPSGAQPIPTAMLSSPAFVPCDPKLIVFAMLGAMSWIPKWYVPEGAMTPKEIGEAFASYLTRGLLAARTAPLDGARAAANASESADRRKARARRPARPRAVGGRT